MKVEVVYALAEAVDVVSVSVPPAATLRDALVASGLLEKHAGISLEKQAFGIFGRRAVLETRLTDGDRVEIYRALALDPKEARRQRAAKKR